MNTWISSGAAIVLFCGSFLVSRAPNRKAGRSRSVYTAVAALVLNLIPMFLPQGAPLVSHSGAWLGTGRHILVAAFCNGLIGLIAVGLSPLYSHGRRSFATILRLIALGNVFLTIQHPVILVLCWFSSASLIHHQLKRTTELRDEARLFATYQLPSAVLFALGVGLIAAERPEWAALPLVVSFAAREAVFPLHGWFVRFVEKAPLGVVVAFVSPQLGVYAHLEVLQPHLGSDLAHGTAFVGAISALFAAFLALGQVKARRAAAYLVMSQTGLVAFGLESASPVARSGALLMWFVLSLGSSGFLLAISALAARRGELVVGQSAGQVEQVPRLASATLLLGLATVGCPLTLGFVAEDLLVQGSVIEHPMLALALIGVTALNGITVMRLYFGLFTAGPHRPGERDLGSLEAAMHTLVLGLLVVAGVFPGAILSFIQ